MKYILILYLTGAGWRPALTTAVFQDKPACEAAISTVLYEAKRTHWDFARDIFHVCVPQGTEIP